MTMQLIIYSATMEMQDIWKGVKRHASITAARNTPTLCDHFWPTVDELHSRMIDERHVKKWRCSFSLLVGCCDP